ncbi:MAG: manganese efflux pump [Lachnospiraceae bacterium]|nr:manganese efflux pump [Lachnospiraceae bacterium]
MKFDFLFFFNSILMGVGLAMDAFSVSLANGLGEPQMKAAKTHTIAGTFGAFQLAMPLIGWICVHTIVNIFSSFQKFVPWIALILLLYIGIKMIVEGIKNKDGKVDTPAVGFAALMIQAVATSIDALSVGFTIADYDFLMAFTESLIIGIVTYFICLLGLKLGKTIGTKIAGRASILGGAILVFIGIEIFIKGIWM